MWLCVHVFVYPFNDNADKYTAYFYLACNHLETKPPSCVLFYMPSTTSVAVQVLLFILYKYNIYISYILYGNYCRFICFVVSFLFLRFPLHYRHDDHYYMFLELFRLCIVPDKAGGRRGADPCVSPVQVCCYGDACIAADCMQCNRRGAPPESIHDVETVHDGGASASGLHDYTHMYIHVPPLSTNSYMCVCERELDI